MKKTVKKTSSKMHNITVLCDRCYKSVEGKYNPDTNETEGFYYVKSGDFKDLKQGCERYVCNKCVDGFDRDPVVHYPEALTVPLHKSVNY